MIDVKQLQTIIENLITSSMREVRDDRDLLDSFSPNQFLSKMNLINHINDLNILDKDSEIVIFGSWYGSILIPAFYNKVKKIIQRELPKTMWFQNKENDHLYTSNIAKIRDLHSCYDSQKRTWEWHSGLQIDLFIVKKDGDYIVSDTNWDPNINKIKYNDVFPLKILKFEGIDINVPRKYKKYLKTVFGSESPKIPPIDDRIPHEGNGKVKPFETCEWFAKNYPQLYD